MNLLTSKPVYHDPRRTHWSWRRKLPAYRKERAFRYLCRIHQQDGFETSAILDICGNAAAAGNLLRHCHRAGVPSWKLRPPQMNFRS